MGREKWSLGLALLGLVCPCTEEEKAEAQAFEEDQVAGRLKEDVVSVTGRWWERRVGRSCSWELTLFSLCSWSREAGCRSRWQRR